MTALGQQLQDSAKFKGPTTEQHARKEDPIGEQLCTGKLMCRLQNKIPEKILLAKDYIYFVYPIPLYHKRLFSCLHPADAILEI